jgi:type IV secretory pathway component VirB8
VQNSSQISYEIKIKHNSRKLLIINILNQKNNNYGGVIYMDEFKVGSGSRSSRWSISVSKKFNFFFHQKLFFYVF